MLMANMYHLTLHNQRCAHFVPQSGKQKFCKLLSIFLSNSHSFSPSMRLVLYSVTHKGRSYGLIYLKIYTAKLGTK